MRTRHLYLALSILFLLASMDAQADILFTDWTGWSTNSASGSLDGISVSLNGGDIVGAGTDGTSTVFSNSAVFNPALPLSDWVQVTAPHNSTFTYQVTFGSAIKDPIMHLHSLGSVLDFQSIALTKVSGEPQFEVLGNTVTGTLLGYNPTYGWQDTSGTILLNGTFTSFTFTAHCLVPISTDRDGINVQIGAAFPQPVPVPSAFFLGAIGLGVVGRKLRRRRIA